MLIAQGPTWIQVERRSLFLMIPDLIVNRYLASPLVRLSLETCGGHSGTIRFITEQLTVQTILLVRSHYIGGVTSSTLTYNS